MIINFKQTQRKINSFNGSESHELLAEGVVASNYTFDKNLNMKKINKYLDARVFLTGWSLYLGWGGTGMCLLVSMLWIILSKIMRYNSFNMLFIT
ncbi:hypothetical protein Phum_PHUM444980 [Pediculus humanus corporis]|uniref:Uncharacterized protein n=1 Tax=Pediculus humanus subsp. corporis TaxID=121224 RepID=E0VU39_PEDHC|nr:uncharacterized protein Phum_PHUM444980 [Pediculus humanus corporis]EEB16895.1 hypothetical protein Phum_PHUM444980 [Pediculus humanus corporis]